MSESKQIKLSRGKGKGGPVLSVPLCYNLEVSASSGIVTTYDAIATLLGDTGDWSSMANTWSEFRVKSIKLDVLPAAPSNTLTANVAMAAVFDPQYAGSGLTSLQLLTYADKLLIPAGIGTNKGRISKTWQYPSSGGASAVTWYATGSRSSLPGSFMIGSIGESGSGSTQQVNCVFTFETEFRTFAAP